MILGTPIDRVDGHAKVTGRARYAAEFAAPGLLHAVLVQSTTAAGEILGIDVAEASGMPGVVLVITPDNALRLQVPEKPATEQEVDHPLLQNRTIRYSGQHVGVVVAATREQAVAAAARVRVRTREGEALTVMDHDSLARAYVPKNFRDGQRPPDSHRGDPDADFAAAPVRIEVTYETPVEHHNPMEPHATVARWDGDKLTVWHSTQGVTGAQKTLAQLFGLKPDDVRVVCPFLGGGFGSKGNCWPPATLAAMAARMVGHPVKLELTRAQMYTSNGYRPATRQTVKLGAQADGKLVALRHDGFSSMSMPELGEFVEPFALASEMLYDVPAAAISHRLVGLNQGLPTYMRAPGEAPGVHALECAMDELAVALRMDPIALRLANHADVDRSEDKPFSAKKLRECYARGAEAFGWSRRTPEPRSMRDGRLLVGMGMATSTYPMNRMAAKATARMDADGTVVVRSGTQDIGTGTYTVMTQVAADELGLPAARVRFELGDTAWPAAPVSGGSQTVASVGPAVQAACAALRAKLAGMGVAPDFADLRAGLARAGVDHVEADGEASYDRKKAKLSEHSFGAQFAEVTVDPDLGEIRVARFVGAFDAGRILNPKTARSQLIGGIAFGLGMALLEETTVDGNLGRITNPNVSEYLMAVNADVRQVEAILIDNDDQAANPLGARGIGELPMVGAAAAIANAVFHATGTRVRKLPIRLEDVLA